MAGVEDGRRRYHVHCSGAVAKALRQLQRESQGAARKKAIASAFRQIVKRLQHNPTEFGEPYYRLPGLRLQVRTCIISPLVVHFAVSADQPLVFIKAVRLLPA